MKKSILKKTAVCAFIIGLSALTVACSDEAPQNESAKHTHTPVKVSAKEATCTEAGNAEYWTCASCSETFSDKACTQKTNADAVKTSPLGHIFGEVEYTLSRDKASCTASRVCLNDSAHVESETVQTKQEGSVVSAKFESEVFGDWERDITVTISAVEIFNTDSPQYDPETKTFSLNANNTGDDLYIKVVGTNLDLIYGSGESWKWFIQYSENHGIDLDKHELTLYDGYGVLALPASALLSETPFELAFTVGKEETKTGYFVRYTPGTLPKFTDILIDTDSPAYNKETNVYTVTEDSPLVITFVGENLNSVTGRSYGYLNYGGNPYFLNVAILEENQFTVVDENTVTWTFTSEFVKMIKEHYGTIIAIGYVNGAAANDYNIINITIVAE